MSLTIQQILSDAKRLASRLKEHDTAADVLLSQTQSVYKQLDAMKQVRYSPFLTLMFRFSSNLNDFSGCFCSIKRM